MGGGVVIVPIAILVGITMMIVGENHTWRPELPDLWKLLERLGEAVLIAGLIKILDRYLDGEAEERLGEIFHEGITELRNASRNAADAMYNASPVLRGAALLSITAIHRRDGDGHKEYRNELAHALKEEITREGGEVLIHCVAGHIIFGQRSPLRRILRDGLHDSQSAKLRVVLACPESEWLIRRAEMEDSSLPSGAAGRVSSLGHYNEEAIQLLMAWRDVYGPRVKFRVFDTPPRLFTVITSQYAFGESYTMRHPTENDNGFLGGAVPLHVVMRDSTAFQRYFEDFEYTWDCLSHEVEYHGTARVKPDGSIDD
jgi:hypothetical protein